VNRSSALVGAGLGLASWVVASAVAGPRAPFGFALPHLATAFVAGVLVAFADRREVWPGLLGAFLGQVAGFALQWAVLRPLPTDYPGAVQVLSLSLFALPVALGQAATLFALDLRDVPAPGKATGSPAARQKGKG
jgi:hypothetical protein